MTISRILLVYAITAVCFVGLDAVWLSLATGPVYRAGIGHLMADRVELAPAVGVYVVYVAGLVAFAVLPALDADSAWKAVGHGALLGLVAYGTYDFTNEATLKDWPWRVTLADMAWGTIASGVAAGIARLVVRRFL